MMIEIKCYEVIGTCFFMLFFLTVKCQCKFYSKLNSPKQMSGDFLGTQAFTILCSQFSISLGSFLSIKSKCVLKWLSDVYIY